MGADRRKVFEGPQLRVEAALSALARARDALAPDLIESVRLNLLTSDFVRIYLQADPMPDQDAAVHKRCIDKIMDTVSEIGEPFSRNRGARSQRLDDNPDLVSGGLILALMSLAPDAENVVQPAGPETLFVLDDAAPEDQVNQAAEIVRRCPMARFGAAETAQKDLVSLVLVRDELDRGSSLSGMIAGEQAVSAPALVRYETQAGSIFLPRDRTFSRETLRDLGLILNAVIPRPPSDEPEEVPLASVMGAYRGEEAGWHTFRCTLPARDARELMDVTESETFPEDGAAWCFQDLRETEASLEALLDTIGNAAPRAGYRLTLHPYSPSVQKGQNLANILERITELEIQAAFLHGMEAPQTVLLRFTRTQLPAMADFIESIPVDVIDAGHVHYAFYTSAGVPEGVHFLMYDPALVLPSRPFLEWDWRNATKDTPIQYWVDPNWARIYGRDVTGVRSKVFTPRNVVLHPTLQSYAPENMDTYLRDLVARRLSSGDQNEPVRALLDDPRCAPGLIFSESTDPDFEVEIDVIDLDSFEPLRQRLDWINDNLLMNDPAFVDQDRIQLIAQALFEGSAAKGLLAEMGAHEEAASREAEAMTSRMTDRLSVLSERFREEFNASVEQAELMTGRIETLASRVADIEAMLVEAEDLNVEAAIYTDSLAPMSADIETYRDEIEATLRATLEEAETYVSTAEKRLTQAHKSVDELVQRLKRVRQ
jgi:hypothetical protein